MESIKEKLEKSKYLTKCLQNTAFFICVSFILASLVVLGSIKLNLTFKNQTGINIAEEAFPTNLNGKAGAYVASKAGKSYYFPWCGSANRIKDANLVWFSNRAIAEAKGYVPASNCYGLK